MKPSDRANQTTDRSMTGLFMAPQNFSVNDGDGIRTLIFFAGCPLRCSWCSNPESHISLNQAAPDQRGSNAYIRRYTVQEILDLTEKQGIFYRKSGGGITFSGGEATLQPEMLRTLVSHFYDRAIPMALETSAWFEFEAIRDILGRLDLIFMDIKHMDPGKHRDLTGRSNEKILDNIARTAALKVPIIIRIPLIEGVNADEDNIRATARFVKTNVLEPKIELLPYHAFGDEKYRSLGMPLPSRDFKAPDSSKISRLIRIIQSEGGEVVSFR